MEACIVLSKHQNIIGCKIDPVFFHYSVSAVGKAPERLDFIGQLHISTRSEVVEASTIKVTGIGAKDARKVRAP